MDPILHNEFRTSSEGTFLAVGSSDGDVCLLSVVEGHRRDWFGVSYSFGGRRRGGMAHAAGRPCAGRVDVKRASTCPGSAVGHGTRRSLPSQYAGRKPINPRCQSRLAESQSLQQRCRHPARTWSDSTLSSGSLCPRLGKTHHWKNEHRAALSISHVNQNPKLRQLSLGSVLKLILAYFLKSNKLRRG